MKSASTYDSLFTNRYELAKTLRFELRPVGATQRLLEENNVFEKDHIRQQKYLATKPYLDNLHREFINTALQGLKFGELSQYLAAYRAYKKDKNLLKDLEKAEKKLRIEAADAFNITTQVWKKEHPEIKFKKNNFEFLLEEGVFELLKAKYGDVKISVENGETTEEVSLFNQWKGFNGYFTKFNETRRHMYSADGKAGAIATRLIHQNLRKFADNLGTFSTIKDKIDVSEVDSWSLLTSTELFTIDYYNHCLTQDGIDMYNAIIGGKLLVDGSKVRGLNELVNEYCQKAKDKLPYLKLLDKQILSEKESFIDEIVDDEHLQQVLGTFLTNTEEKVLLFKQLLSKFAADAGDFNLAGVYINKKLIDPDRSRFCNNSDLPIFLSLLYKQMQKEKHAGIKYSKKEDEYTFPESIPLSFVKQALWELPIGTLLWKDHYFTDSSGSKQFILADAELTKWNEFLALIVNEYTRILEPKNYSSDSPTAYRYFTELQALLRTQLLSNESETKSVALIKEYADMVLAFYQTSQMFAVEKKRQWNPDALELDDFYMHPTYGYEQYYSDAYEKIIKPYNLMRNYLTKKPFSTQKWKLNFDNPTLVDGWDENKESANFGILLIKGSHYYLGLMKKGHTKIFSDAAYRKACQQSSDQNYGKVIYKLFPDPSRMFPKVCFSKKGLEFFDPSDEIMKIYKNEEFKKGDQFSLESMHKLIEFYKECLVLYPGWKMYDFSRLKPSSAYGNGIDEFYNDVAVCGYQLAYQRVSEEYIHQKNLNGELFLFQIYNKDFSKKSTGAESLHTLYFKTLFSQENEDTDYCLKLNGEAEIFYRPKTDVNKLGTKNDKAGKEVINHKRYAQDKIFFHVPITLNRTADSANSSKQFNLRVNNYLSENKVNIIGVDRGEKHLAYYSVIDPEGNCIESKSLNTINGVDYHALLTQKQIDREQQRKDWISVEAIKDLKKGYISQVVHILVDLAIKHNAIIVLEDLNMRFKQVRGGIEKSVYQQLEKALIDKLNFLVNKHELDPTKAGHVLKAYQLTAPFDGFNKMGKQSGILFYIQAAYTSKIDPVTGWRPHVYLRYSNVNRAREEILSFKLIEFKNNRFEFTYDIKDFRKQAEYPTKTVWTICSNVERYYAQRIKNTKGWEHKKYDDITKPLINLFTEVDIDYTADIKAQIAVLTIDKQVAFFKNLIFYINLICQIRNTDPKDTALTGSDDFILSPVEPFFDSRNAEKFGKHLPKNGDENGAYNIARKGILILQKIESYKQEYGACDGLKWNDLAITYNDWDSYASGFNI